MYNPMNPGGGGYAPRQPQGGMPGQPAPNPVQPMSDGQPGMGGQPPMPPMQPQQQQGNWWDLSTYSGGGRDQDTGLWKPGRFDLGGAKDALRQKEMQLMQLQMNNADPALITQLQMQIGWLREDLMMKMGNMQQQAGQTTMVGSSRPSPTGSMTAGTIGRMMGTISGGGGSGPYRRP